jgi:DNA-directed RNA polymerase subunit RPC12/RpoP
MSTPERKVKEPTVTKAPPAGRKFPCPQCGAKLDFDPTTRALACPYCGHKVKIEHGSKDLKEHDLEAYLRDRDNLKTPVEGHANQVTCPACNAIVLLEDKVVTDRCPYCSTHLENVPRVAETMIQPEGVLPFKVDNREAIEAFARWLGSLWFAPNALRKLANLGQLNGIYVPFWTFDSMTYTHYTGLRGDNYWETETYTETNAQGQTETKTRQVMRTLWTPVAGEVRHFFDDVLICASKGLPEEYRTKVMPRELKGLEEFKPDFLSGFKTERYQIGPRDGFDRARDIMDQQIRQLCCTDIGGDQQQLQSVQTRHVGVTFKHVLLPVWLASYRYQERAYRVIVNGRTGEIMGDRPYSWVKITLLVLGILLAILLAVLVFATLSKGGEPPARHASPEQRPTPAIPASSAQAHLPPRAAWGAAPELAARRSDAWATAPVAGWEAARRSSAAGTLATLHIPCRSGWREPACGRRRSENWKTASPPGSERCGSSYSTS